MRRIEASQFEAPYKKSSTGQKSNFESEIKADAPAASALAHEVFSDFDINVHGIKWWAAYPDFGDKRRILVGDYLWQTAISVSTNLAEARLHLMELNDALELVHEGVKGAISVDQFGKPNVSLPTRSSVKDELPHRLVGLHTAGLFRAMGSVFDCLAANCIGVVGLPFSIKRADMEGVRRALNRLIEKGGLAAGHPHFDFNAKLKSLIDASGPKNWLEWVNSYRNVVVHRGRRTEFIMLLPKPTGLFKSDGAHHVTSSAVPMLVKDPDNTDVEGWLKFSDSSLLSECSIDTLEGAFSSVRMFAEEISLELARIWKERRKNPQLITQPPGQWKFEEESNWSFEGFKPGSAKFHVDEMRSADGVATRRMQVAAADDKNLSKWNTFS